MKSDTTISTTDYFALFELPRHLGLDVVALESEFYRLSRQWHPDRFARSAPAEKQRSLEMTSQLNDAYRTLKDPLARTEYLLALEGKPIERDKNAEAKEIPADLLEEVFELNMQLEEMRSGDDDPQVRADLENARGTFEAQLESVGAQLRDLWTQWDQVAETRDKSAQTTVLDAMVALLHRRQYISNLVRDVRAALETE